ncbi:interleukin 2 receptor, gamma b [Chanos chanos]|uniref:Interleukin 2 receptor, gamma b n=1 Tax=Chanos chanos TaxID=29144 RepID=A0A6J2UN45_CHACN|nr:cytokine receptor common subunit gamma-like [Chanos chanos]
MFLTCLVLPLLSLATTATEHPSVKCIIINLEYVHCTWTAQSLPAYNYTFNSSLQDEPHTECPRYLQRHGYNIGCLVPLQSPEDRFGEFSTSLFYDVNSSVSLTHKLRMSVKLNPPYNLTLTLNGSSELWLHWEYNAPGRSRCIVSQVRYKKMPSEWQLSPNVTVTSFSLPEVSGDVEYTFQVRLSVHDLCGSSLFWSDWSEPASFKPKKRFPLGLLFVIFATTLLIALAILLCYCERIKVILLPAVPSPSKNLQDLFSRYDSNTESWAHISRDLKEAFETGNAEPRCVLCKAGDCCKPVSVQLGPP